MRYTLSAAMSPKAPRSEGDMDIAIMYGGVEAKIRSSGVVVERLGRINVKRSSDKWNENKTPGQR